MFHPDFLGLFSGNPHSMADEMRLVSALKVEQDLQQAWREEKKSKFNPALEPVLKAEKANRACSGADASKNKQ